MPTIDGKRVAAIEILLSSQLVRDLILKGEVQSIKEAMEKSENIGMQTFDGHLMRLYRDGIISLEEALKNSDSPNNLKLKINLAEGFSGSPQQGTEKTARAGLTLEEIQKDEEEEENEET